MQNTMLDSIVSPHSQELPNASSALKLFENPQFRVRVIMRCSEPWFVAKDVATCIEHSNVSKMCELCRDKDKAVVRPSDLTSNDLLDVKNREYTLISEAGLYRILAKCNLPKCEPFESWVFDEVLPSIRKTGSYGMSQISRKDQLFLAIIHSESEEGREVKRPKDLKTSKKSNEPLDTFDNVIDVTRITTECTTVFVSASACNPSFGQGYAHLLIGEKAMTNQNASASASANLNLVADENGNINCSDCSDCSDCSECVECAECAECSECTEGTLFMQELLERHGMLFLSRLQ